MIRQIAPVFFTMNIPPTLAYYKDKLGFDCLGTWQDPPVYAIVARDDCAIHFRCAEPPTSNPEKYEEELLDAYIFVEDALSRMRMRFMRSTRREAWNLSEDSATCRGGRASLS